MPQALPDKIWNKAIFSIGRILMEPMFALSLSTFVTGFVICFAGLKLILYLAKKQRFRNVGIDEPDGLRKNHSNAVLRLGGISVFVSFLVLSGLTQFNETFPSMDSLSTIALGALLIFTLGAWDDFKPLPAKVKLTAQILIATLMWKMGLRVDLFSHPVTGEAVNLAPILSFMISVTWLVAIPNVVNLADGMDGLAGGIGIFLFITLGLVGTFNDFQHGLGVLSFGLVGVMLAFLFFNFPPAKIFLGDGGAYFIGFFIAAASLGSSQKSYIGASIVVTLIALGVPILDTVFAFGRRLLKGVPVMRGDSEHIHHRLLLTGMSSGKALFVLYGVFIVLSILALSTIFNKSLSLWLSLCFLILMALIALRGLGYVRTFRSLPSDFKRIVGARKNVRYAVLVSQLLEMEVYRKQSAREFWGIFEREIARLDFTASPEPNTSELTFHHPFKGVTSWTIGCRILEATEDVSESQTLARETIASCFITPLCLGVKQFGPPDWNGYNSAE